MFEQRARPLRRQLRALTFLGVATPLALGALVAAFGVNDRAVPVALWIAGVLGIVQLIGSAWSLTAKWDDQYAYALQSIADNHRLSDDFKALGERPPSDLSELTTRAAVLDAENQTRSTLDYAQGLTDKEKRRGHRAALHQFQRQCATCGVKPTSMDASDCGTCGRF
jgi:mobilome CxxCx(11)CxxC protein